MNCEDLKVWNRGNEAGLDLETCLPRFGTAVPPIQINSNSVLINRDDSPANDAKSAAHK